MISAPSVWVLTEGHIGAENQALGLAEALGADPVVKRIHPRFPWRALPPRLWLGALHSPGRGSDRLKPPWPDVLITCGKRAAGISVAIKRASRRHTFTVHVQQPPLPAGRFDLLVVPEHDAMRGENVFVTRAAVHRVTPARLEDAAKRFGERLAYLPRPLVAVLIGGSNRRHRLTPAITERIAKDMLSLARTAGAGLAVTPSRRTGEENVAILRRRLVGVPAEIWDGEGENPYFAYLALADAIVVTCDSVSMASEAISTGKPVYVIALEGASRRIDAFHAALKSDGITRPFDGTLARWTYVPPDDTARAAAEIERRLAAR